MKVKEKIVRIVSAMLLSGMIMGLAIAPLSVAAARNLLGECEHQFDRIILWEHYPNADYTSHQRTGLYRMRCSICEISWEYQETVDEHHSVGDNGYCMQCGYRLF